MGKNHQRKCPATMATQHPDNAFPPYWHHKPFVSTAKEVEECYRSFEDLNCQEYMWDWEGKFVDEAVVDRLFQQHFKFFKKHPLGEDYRLTYRVPNIQKEGQARLARAFAGILTAAYTARELGFKRPPLYEVIHPMTTSVRQLTKLQENFHETAKFQEKIFGIKNLKPQFVGIIPLIEGTGTLLKSRKILEDYAKFLEKFTGRRPKILRPFIARSDPALDGGFVAAVMSAKAALSEYHLFQRESGIQVRPIMGVGSLRFRGGLAPNTVEEFLQTYPGIATVTVQSSFRYDHPLEMVKRAIAELNRRLPTQEPFIFSKRDMAVFSEFDKIFVSHYRTTIEGLAEFINQLAPHIPPRRERLQHTGHFGYSRRVGKKGIAMPRAIPFTAVFYSIGVPPELIGIGRGLREVQRRRLMKDLLRFYPNLLEVIRNVGHFYNRENLEILTHHQAPWREVKGGLDYLEEFLGEKLGPKTHDDLLHRNYTSNVIQHWLKKNPVDEDILQAAQVRRSLG